MTASGSCARSGDVRPWHRRILDGVLALAWAPCCAVCDDCWRHLPRLTPLLCRHCGAPLAASSPEDSSCETGHPESDLTRRRAAGVYEGTLRAIIQAFKYQHRQSLSRPLAALMRSAGRELLSGADYVVSGTVAPDPPMVAGFQSGRRPRPSPGSPGPKLASTRSANAAPDDAHRSPAAEQRSRRIRPAALGPRWAAREQR